MVFEFLSCTYRISAWIRFKHKRKIGKIIFESRHEVLLLGVVLRDEYFLKAYNKKGTFCTCADIFYNFLFLI